MNTPCGAIPEATGSSTMAWTTSGILGSRESWTVTSSVQMAISDTMQESQRLIIVERLLTIQIVGNMAQLGQWMLGYESPGNHQGTLTRWSNLAQISVTITSG